MGGTYLSFILHWEYSCLVGYLLASLKTSLSLYQSKNFEYDLYLSDFHLWSIDNGYFTNGGTKLQRLNKLYMYSHVEKNQCIG